MNLSVVLLRRNVVCWIGLCAVAISLYFALRLTLDVLRLFHQAEHCGWLAVLLYWFLYAPAAVFMSFSLVKRLELD
jgi:hypothetical protein